ncbi:hypothetical protein BH23CHL8_BH23CHL8_22320 [soil metagenome]
MPNRLSLRGLASLLMSALLVALLVVPGVAHEHQGSRGWDSQASPQGLRGQHAQSGRPDQRRQQDQLGLAVLHGPVAITLADPTSDGHQLGDLRVTSVATTDASGLALGRLDATLTTTAVDVPEPGDEIRISTLVFSFGEGGESQVVVGGTAVYPAQGATLATGAVTSRPVQGGSGRFAGVGGWAVSEHLEDGSWRHTLFITRALPAMDQGSRGHGWGPAGFVREAIRERISERLVERERARATLPPGAESSGEQPSIVRTDLGAAQPDSAPGHDLGLWHYTIPAGSTLEPHRHPGWQIARIARGELSYTIILGEAEVLSADGSSRIIGLGTHTLRTGDSVIEHPALQHYGANLTDEDVEILAATLYPEGAPLAIPVPTPQPSMSALPSASPGS